MVSTAKKKKKKKKETKKKNGGKHQSAADYHISLIRKKLTADLSLWLGARSAPTNPAREKQCPIPVNLFLCVCAFFLL